MQTKTIDDQLAKIMTFLLMLVVGPSYLTGGWNVGISYILTALAAYLLFTKKVAKLAGPERYFGLICVIYYVYFAWRILATDVDARAARYFHENVIFLVMPLLLMAGYKFDVDWIIKRAADWLFPTCVLMLIFVLIEERYFITDTLERADLNARSPLILGVLVVSGIHISMADWRQRAFLWRLGAIVSWIIGLVVILIWNESRGALVMHLGALGIFITYLICSVRYRWQTNLFRFLSLVVLFLVAVLFAFLVIMNMDTFERFHDPLRVLFTGDISLLDLSSMMRVEMWALALDRVYDAPWLGFGPQNTFAVIADKWPYEQKLGHLHSDFFNHLLGGGIVGIGIYFGVLIAPIVVLFGFRSWDDQAIYICVLCLVLTILGGLSARVFFRPVMIEWVALTYLFCVLICKARGNTAPK